MTRINFDLQLSQNFNLSEFIYSHTALMENITEQFKPSFEVVNNLHLLCVNVLQPLRDKVGGVIISSGYRCEKVNQLIGGVIYSQHLYGKAADITVKDFDQALRIIMPLQFDQLIIYKSFFHVSYNDKWNRRQIINERR